MKGRIVTDVGNVNIDCILCYYCSLNFDGPSSDQILNLWTLAMEFGEDECLARVPPEG